MHVKSVCSFFVTFMGINYFEWDILFLVPTNVKTLPLGLLLRNILHLLKESYLHCSHFPHAQWKPRGIFLVPSVLHFFGLSKSLMLQRWIFIMISSLVSSFLPDKLNQTPYVISAHCIVAAPWSRVVTWDCPRSFDQVGHQTTNAPIGNKHFFTKQWYRQTY